VEDRLKCVIYENYLMGDNNKSFRGLCVFVFY